MRISFVSKEFGRLSASKFSLALQLYSVFPHIISPFSPAKRINAFYDEEPPLFGRKARSEGKSYEGRQIYSHLRRKSRWLEKLVTA